MRYGTISGQSNAENMFVETAAWYSGDARARAYYTSGQQRIGNVSDGYPPGTPVTTYGGAYTPAANGLDGDGLVLLANSLAAAVNGEILLFPSAVGGSRISTWMSGGANWQTHAARVTASGIAPCWTINVQGESDVTAGTNLDVYSSSLVTLQQQFVTQSGKPAADFGFAVVPLGPCTTGWAAEGGFGPMRQRHINHAASNVGAYLINSGLDATLKSGDPVHWNLASYARQGRRWAEWVRRWAAGDGGALAGPRITGATRSGAQITLTIAHAGGTALLDGAGGAGAALAGFRVFDGGTPVTISGTAIVNATTLTLTLASTPAGTVTMDFGMANLPFGSAAPGPASILYDNTAVAGDTVGIPLQPRAAFTVS